MGKQSRRHRARASQPDRPAARVSVPAQPPWTTPVGAQIAALAVGVVSLVVYLLTLHHGVPGGDSGEMIGAAATTGVAHPSGYPLLLLLAKLTGLVPVADFATRVNAFSAFADAAAAGLLCYAAARASGSTAAGILAAGVWAFSTRIWSYATVAEVFALNNLIIAGLVATLVAAQPRASRRHVAIAALLAGLGTNHLTSVFFSVPILLSLALSARRTGESASRLIWTILGGGLAGLLPYLYLPFASAKLSPVSWGDQTTLTGFLIHVLRTEYGTFVLGNGELGSVAGGVEHAMTYLRDVPGQLFWIGVPLALFGIVRGLRDRSIRPAMFPLVAALIVYVIVFNALSNLSLDTPILVEIQSRFWQMPNLIVCLFVAIGFAATMAVFPSVPRAVPMATAVLIAGAQLALNYRTMDESRNRWVEIYGRSILTAAPQRALILSRGDLATNSLRYLRYGEGVRPDVEIVDQEELSRSWGPPRYARRLPDVTFPAMIYDPGRPDGFSIRQFIDANIGRRPIVVCGGFRAGDNSVTPAAYRMVPDGICLDVARAGEPFDLEAWLARTKPLLPDVVAFANDHPRPNTFESLALDDFWNAWHARAHFVMSCEDCGLSADARLLRFASLAEEIIHLGPTAPVPVYKNLAYALVKVYGTHPEVHDRLVTALQEYLKVAPADDRDLPAVRDNLRRLTGK